MLDLIQAVGLDASIVQREISILPLQHAVDILASTMPTGNVPRGKSCAVVYRYETELHSTWKCFEVPRARWLEHEIRTAKRALPHGFGYSNTTV
jgi:hypothetical protein